MSRSEITSTSDTDLAVPRMRGVRFQRMRLELPNNLTFSRWLELGPVLNAIEAVSPWWVGDWWVHGEHHAYGERAEAARDLGLVVSTCRNRGRVARMFPAPRRRYALPFAHYEETCSLPVDEQDRQLALMERAQGETGKLLPVRQLRQEVKRQRRQTRETEMADTNERVAKQIGHRQYGVILADPPWDFEAWSGRTGMDRAAANHYGTMTTGDIGALQVPAGRNCVLFLWATAPHLVDAINTLAAWDFDYASHLVWMKDKVGTGYWARSQHELVLIGTRGSPPAPAPGTQPNSVFKNGHDTKSRHSEKPAALYEIIERIYPNQAKLEMFARKPRKGWDVWGNDEAVLPARVRSAHPRLELA